MKTLDGYTAADLPRLRVSCCRRSRNGAVRLEPQGPIIGYVNKIDSMRRGTHRWVVLPNWTHQRVRLRTRREAENHLEDEWLKRATEMLTEEST
jgi:hypothetical protein